MATREVENASPLTRTPAPDGRLSVRFSLSWPAERTALVAIVGLSTAVRFFAAIHRSTPVLYPDEYLYAALSRGIAATGLPLVRGAFPKFYAVLVPYLLAPTALIHSVATAYHVGQLEGSLAFSLAAVPAFALARRVGVSSRGAMVVALVTVLVPDGAFTAMLVTGPYAYPLFLGVTLLAVDSLVTPTWRRQAALLVAFVLLAGARMQFVFFPVSYLVAALILCRSSLRVGVRRQAIVFVSTAVVAAVVLALGKNRSAGYYSAGLHVPDPGTFARWAFVELFVLLIATGWVIVPAAAAGCVRMSGTGQERARAFVVVTLTVLAGLIGEAAYVDVSDGISHERYVFYAVPLLATIAVGFAESSMPTRLYRSVAYVCVGGAILVPSTSIAHNAMNAQAPTLVGLYALVGGNGSLSIVWALALAAVMALVALRIVSIRQTFAIALALELVLAIAASADLLNPASLGPNRFQPDHRVVLGPAKDVLLGAPPGTALITSSENNNFLLMKVLFVNPSITRVLVIGGPTAVDGFAGTEVWAGSPRGLTGAGGAPVPGPFAVDQETTAIERPGDRPRTVLASAPGLLFLGLNSSDHYLASAAILYLRSDARADKVTLQMVSRDRRRSIAVSCLGLRRRIDVGKTPVTVTIPGVAHAVRQCRLSLVHGAAGVYDDRIVSVRVTKLAYTAGR